MTNTDRTTHMLTRTPRALSKGALTFLFAALVAASLACGRNDAPPVVEAEDEHADEGPASELTLSKAAFETANLRIEPASAASSSLMAEDGGLVVPGQVELDPRRVQIVSARVDGRLERLEVVEGDAVEAGQIVAELFSPAFLTAQSDYRQALRRVTEVRSADSALGREMVDAASQRLRLLGVAAEDIARIAESDAPMERVALRAPMAGRVIHGEVIPGSAVSLGEPILTIADLSELDVVAEIPEVSLRLVQIGRRATIGIAAFPDLRFAGQVERIRDVLSPETRTIPAVIHVRNPNGALRPGMYATVRIDAQGARAIASEGVILPETAVVIDGAERIVFVEIASRRFERRVVQVEPVAAEGSMRPAGRFVRVLGVRSGERVVMAGAFTLKAELAKAELGEDH